MEWITTHLTQLVGAAGVGVLLVLWRAGFFGWALRFVTTLRKAFRDQERADALRKCGECAEELKAVKLVLRGRIIDDDARDEIHQQDLAEKKQMSACIVRLKARLRENEIAFDDLL